MKDHFPESAKGIIWLQHYAFRFFHHQESMKIFPVGQSTHAVQESEILTIKAILTGYRDTKIPEM